MYILILILVAIASSFFTLLLHCCVIVGKESEKDRSEIIEDILSKGRGEKVE